MQLGTEHFSKGPHSHSVRVDKSGRIVVPAELRQRCRIQPGDHVILAESHGHLTVKSYDQVIKEVQAYFADAAPPGVLLSEELIKDRRAEAARELAELNDSAASHD